jgi:peptide/nickel transport system substrate-binding protein
VGIALDIAPIDNGALIKRMLSSDYEAIYYRPLTTDFDPAVNIDFWSSSGSAHFWNLPDETSPARKGPVQQDEGPAPQDWEARIDKLMADQASTTDLEKRKQIFNEVQKVFAENLPVLYFVAPRLYYAHNARVLAVVPSVQRPPALWNADMIGVRH